jgi:hypothetical protein
MELERILKTIIAGPTGTSGNQVCITPEKDINITGGVNTPKIVGAALELDHNDANNETPTTELNAARNEWRMTSSQLNANERTKVKNLLSPNSDLTRSESVEGSPVLSAAIISQ